VSEEADGYQCFTCYAEVRFFTCPECEFKQTVSKRWEAFTCSRCGEKVDLPKRWSYAASTKAREVEGTGETWPKL
jgi:transcription initiation factor IIE alpha subunit